MILNLAEIFTNDAIEILDCEFDYSMLHPNCSQSLLGYLMSISLATALIDIAIIKV
jgi:hypothetical protein